MSTLTLTQYQTDSRSTAIYPRPTPQAAFAYVSLGLVGEAGEVANKVKKILRGDHATEEDVERAKAEIGKELGDVLWYLAQLASEFDVDLGEVAQANLDKLAVRQAAGTLKGSGDSR